MELYLCPSCTHIQTPYKLTDGFYNSYNILQGSAQYFGALELTENKLHKLQQYAVSFDYFIDIGCGTGHALGIASRFFDHCLGIEPAYNSYCIAKEKGLDVVHAYFSRDLKLEEKGKVSAFTAFQVFEHLTDLESVLDYIFEILQPGGVGLINVPNGQKIVGESLYHQLTFEHVNYYSVYSACTMARRAGFEIIQVEDIPGTLEIDLYVRKPKLRMTFNQVKLRQRKQLTQMLAPYKTVTVWGAGAKSEKYVDLLEDASIVNCLLDSSLRKVGQYVAGFEVPVEEPTSANVNKNPIIIIFASSYNDEIIERLRKQEMYTGDIIYFENNELQVNKREAYF